MPELFGKTVAIRADAAFEIGTGHVMRMLALASGLANAGARITFLSRDVPGNLNHLITAAGHTLKSLPAPADAIDPYNTATWLGASINDDIAQCFSATEVFDIVIADHYGINETWCLRAREKSKLLVCVDDEALRILPCDILINQNYFHEQATIDRQLSPSTCRKLIGPKYAMLRPEFSLLHTATSVRTRLKNILILIGGRDIHNIGLNIAAQIPAGSFAVKVIGGDDETRRLCEAQGHRFLSSSTTIAEDMATADFCFGAAGSSSWERCCLGLPSALFIIAKNQQQVVYNLEQAGACINLGDYRHFDFLKIPTILSVLSNDTERLATMSAAAHAMTDGRGVERIINALKN